jgi:AcrR family transcriptional regulator
MTPEPTPAATPGDGASPFVPEQPTARRLPAAERRRQLIGIGLQLLTERPLGDITVEEVSRRAGISRGLLFNYFPTRRDYHLAIIRAAMRRMSRIAEPPETVAEDMRVKVVIERFVAFLERRRDPYVAIIRGVAGGDAEVAEIYAESRDQLVGVVLRALGRRPTPALELLVAGWLGFVEETVLTWVNRPVMPRHELVRLLERALLAIVERRTAPRDLPNGPAA